MLSHNMLRQFMAQAPYPAAIFDKQMRYLAVNDAWLTTYNLQEADILGAWHYDIVPEIPQRWRDGHQRVLQHGETLNGQSDPFLWRDGRLDYIDWRCTPWYADDGSIGGLMMYASVVTERVQLPTHQPASMTGNILGLFDSFFRSLFDGLMHPAAILDNSGDILMLNRRAAVALQYDPDGPQNITDFLPRLSERLRDDMQQVILHGEMVLSEHYFDIETGAGWYLLSVQPLFDSQGHTIAMLMIAQNITDRKEAETQLREREAQLRQAQSIAQIAAWRMDAEGRLYGDSELRRQLTPEFSDKPLHFHHVVPLIHPDDRDRVQAYIAEQFESDDHFSMEYRVLAPDGQTHWLWTDAKRIVPDDGTPPYLIGTTQDITLRKQQQIALQESEARYRSLVAALSEGVVMHDSSGQIIASNAAAERILGLTSDQLYGRTSTDPHWYTLHDDYSPFPGDDHPAMVTLRTGEPQHNVIMGVQRPDDSLRWLSVNAEPIFMTGRDSPDAVVASFTDITQTREMIQQLRDSEERFRVVVENAPVAIVGVDSLGQIRLVNAQLTKLLGYERHELLNHPLDKLVPQPVRQQHEHWRRSFFKEHISRTMGHGDLHIYGEHKDGRLVPLDVALSHIETPETQLVIAFVVDMSERQAAEEARRETEIVTIKLTKERELHDLKKRFLSMISHDLRTPMAVIMTSTAILRRQYDVSLHQDLHDRIDRIDAQVKRLNKMIDDVSFLSKQEQVKHEIRLSVLSIEDFLMQLIDEVRLAYDDRTLVTLHIVGVYRRYWLDEVLLHQIGSNLIGNAVKYSPPGSPVTVTCRTAAHAIVLEVADRGIGIPQDDQAHLFNLFHRASNAIDVDGTGVGLTIVQEAVDAMGGSVTFASTVGEGTTFTVMLPCRTDEAD